MLCPWRGRIGAVGDGVNKCSVHSQLQRTSAAMAGREEQQQAAGPEPSAGAARREELKQRRAQQKAEALKQRRAQAKSRRQSATTASAACASSAASAGVAEVGSMESDLGRALAACGTSNSWSTLEAVAAKVSRRTGRRVTPRELDELMLRVGDAALLAHGVWRTSFGKKYMPIVCVNTAFARSAAAAAGNQWTCTCGAAGTGASGGCALAQNHKKQTERYFGSQDYNAGRHACTASVHKGQCLMWQPPTSGHLHSWRRGFADDGRR